MYKSRHRRPGRRPASPPPWGENGCPLHSIEWNAATDGVWLEKGDTFQKGHTYRLYAWLQAESGDEFAVKDRVNDEPDVSGTLNGSPVGVKTAYEQDPTEIVELYHYDSAPTPEVHRCAPVPVEKVEPSCVQPGFEADYHCACGKDYQDPEGKKPVDLASGALSRPPVTLRENSGSTTVPTTTRSVPGAWR